MHMRRMAVPALAGLLAAALSSGAALAGDKASPANWTGWELEYLQEYKLQDWDSTMTPNRYLKLKAKIDTTVESSWGFYGELEDGNILKNEDSTGGWGDLQLRKYRAWGEDELFRIDAWGYDFETSDVGDYVGLNTAAKKESGQGRIQLHLKPANAKLQVKKDEGFLFVERAVGNLTLGGSFETTLPSIGAAGGTQDVVGFAKTTFGNITLGAAAGSTSGIMSDGISKVEKDSSAFGVKTEIKLSTPLRLEASSVRKQENFDATGSGGDNTTKGKLIYETKTVKVETELSNQDDNLLAESEPINTLWSRAVYTGPGNTQGFDDVFATDKYYNNVALAADGKFTTKNDGTSSATNTIELRATKPFIQGRMWVLGSLKTVSDADGGVSASMAYTGLDALNTQALASVTGETTLSAYARWFLSANKKWRWDGQVTSQQAGNAANEKLAKRFFSNQMTYILGNGWETWLKLENASVNLDSAVNVDNRTILGVKLLF